MPITVDDRLLGQICGDIYLKETGLEGSHTLTTAKLLQEFIELLGTDLKNPLLASFKSKLASFILDSESSNDVKIQGL